MLNTKSIGIVGTRTPTSYGKEVAAEFGQAIAKRGYTVTSGAATGIDSVAHRAVLQRSGNTIAVLGNGVDRVYPAENRALYSEMVERGLLISEFLMGAKPVRSKFPKDETALSLVSLSERWLLKLLNEVAH